MELLISVTVLAITGCWLLALWWFRRKYRRAQQQVVAALGYRRPDGVVEVCRVIKVKGPTVEFNPPLVLQPGESLQFEFELPLDDLQRDKESLQ